MFQWQGSPAPKAPPTLRDHLNVGHSKHCCQCHCISRFNRGSIVATPYLKVDWAQRRKSYHATGQEVHFRRLQAVPVANNVKYGLFLILFTYESHRMLAIMLRLIHVIIHRSVHRATDLETQRHKTG